MKNLLQAYEFADADVDVEDVHWEDEQAGEQEGEEEHEEEEEDDEQEEEDDEEEDQERVTSSFEEKVPSPLESLNR